MRAGWRNWPGLLFDNTSGYVIAGLDVTDWRAVIRYGLALILVSIGVTKFAAHEAEAIQPLVSGSPLMSWLRLPERLGTFGRRRRRRDRPGRLDRRLLVRAATLRPRQHRCRRDVPDHAELHAQHARGLAAGP
ncbi:MAG: DUF417 family protein [Actinomycetota bacterium]|nr:DUF417 family protein [Actinomycetota bacterium]